MYFFSLPLLNLISAVFLPQNPILKSDVMAVVLLLIMLLLTADFFYSPCLWYLKLVESQII